MAQSIGVHPAAVVTDGEVNAATRLVIRVRAQLEFVFPRFSDFHYEAAAPRHRLSSIDGEVNENALDLVRIRHDRGHRQLSLRDDLNVFAHDPGKNLMHFGQRPVQINCAQLQRLLAAESQELLGEGCAALACLKNIRQAFMDERIRYLRFKRQFRKSHDDVQDVIEVVRDSTGQQPSRF